MRIERVDHTSARCAEAIVAEYLHAIGHHVSEDSVRKEVDTHSSGGAAAMWIAFVTERAAGTIAVHPLPIAQTFEIKRLYVKPEARGRGLAKLLMQVAEEHARVHGAKRIFLDTKETMHAAQQLYAGLGYRHIDPYNDNPDVHLHLGKEL